MIEKPLSELALQLKPYIVPWIKASVGAGDYATSTLGVHDLDGTLHTGTLARSQAPWVASDIASHAALPDVHHARQHSIVSSSDHTITGAAFTLVGATATNALGLITPSNNPGTTEAILKSTAGLLTLPQFTATAQVRTPLIDTASGDLTLQPTGNFVRLAAGRGIESNGPFISGFTGSGMRLDDGITKAGKTSIEADNLTVRGTMRVYELVIQQIRMTNGSLLVSSAGKVKAVSGAGPYMVTTDGQHGLAVNDLILAQRWNPTQGALTGTYIYRSALQVTSITTVGADWQFTATLLEGDAPVEGAEYGRIGNTTDTSRQGGVYLTSDDTYAPYIDIYNDVDSMADWTGAAKLKARLGRLNGISDAVLNPTGYGLYSQNAYLSGDFLTGSGTIRMYNASGINIAQDVWGSWDNKRAVQWWPDVASMSGSPSLSIYTGKAVGGFTDQQNFAYIDANPTGGQLAGLSLTAFGQGTGGLATLYLEGGSQALATNPSITLTASTIDLVGTPVLSGTASAQHFYPKTDVTYNLGSAVLRWGTLYVNQIVAGSISGTTMNGAEWEYTGSMVIDANGASNTTVSVVNQGAGVANLAVEGGITSGGVAVSLAGHNHNDLYFTEAESDARYVQTATLGSYVLKVGDTMTGQLNVNAIVQAGSNSNATAGSVLLKARYDAYPAQTVFTEYATGGVGLGQYMYQDGSATWLSAFAYGALPRSALVVAPAALKFIAAPSQNVSPGTALTTQPTIKFLVDDSGNMTLLGAIYAYGNVTALGNVYVNSDIEMTGELLVANGSAATPSIAALADTNTGLYWPAADTLAVTTGGTQRASFSSAGASITGALTGSTTAAFATSVSAPLFTAATGDVTVSAPGSLYLNGVTALGLWVNGAEVAAVNSARLMPAGSGLKDLGDYNRRWATIHAEELAVQTLVAQNVIATIGGDLIVTPTTKLIADITIAAGGIGGSALYTNLAAFWRLEETTGTRYDAKGSSTLGEQGSMASTTGKVGTAASFNGSSFLYASDSATLSVGDINFYLSGWVYIGNDTGANRYIAFKGIDGSSSRAWALYLNGAVGAQRMRFQVWNTGMGSNATVTASTFGNLSINTWYFVEAWHDAAANQIGVAINRTENTTAWSNGVNDDTGDFKLGARAFADYFTGAIDEFGFWKNAIPSSTDRNWLYNSGAGRTFNDIYLYGVTDINVDVEHNNLRSGEWILLKAAPGGIQQTEKMAIASAATAITGGYRYTASRDQDASGPNNWYIGDAVASQQKNAGEGYLWLTATSTIHGHTGPGMIGYVRTGGLLNDVKPVFVKGNLRSFVDYASDEYGDGAGNDLTLLPASGYKGYTIDRTNGMRLFNTDLKLFNAGVETLRLTQAEGLRLTAGSAVQNQIDVYAGADKVYAQWTQLDATFNNTDTWFVAYGKSGLGMGTLTLQSQSADGLDSAYIAIGSTYINLVGKPVTIFNGATINGGTTLNNTTVLTDRGRFRSGASGTAGMWYADSAGNDRAFAGLHTDSASSVWGVWINSVWRLLVDNSGNIGVGGQSFGGGAGVVHIANAATVPSSNPTGGGVLYVQGGALKYRGSSGTVTTIANA